MDDARTVGSGAIDRPFRSFRCGRDAGATRQESGTVDQTVGTATGLIVRGWGIDPYNCFDDAHCADPPYYSCPPRHDITFDVLVDGNVVLRALANVVRPDVYAVAPPLWTSANAGFDYEVPVPPGNHQLCIVAEHQPSQRDWGAFDAPNATLGCFDVSR